MRRAISDLASAYALTQDERYAAHAARLLRLASRQYEDPRYAEALARLPPEGAADAEDTLLYPPAR